MNAIDKGFTKFNAFPSLLSRNIAFCTSYDLPFDIQDYSSFKEL